MELTPNQFKRGLQAGQKQIGLWITLSNAFAAEVVAPTGFDWAMIDMEHSPGDYFSVLGQLQAFAASDTTAIVRPEWNNPVVVKRLLDLGVPGLLFPMINTEEEARKAVAATQYAPKGNRGLSVATRATKFGRIKSYIQNIEDETAVLLQIESVEGLKNAEAIAAIDGVDGIFFGPGDIAADLGLAGQPAHPDVWGKIWPVAEALMSKGMPLGTLTTNSNFGIELFNKGFSFVACGSDAALLAKHSDALLAKVKSEI